jgi:hypothetical protein
MSQGALFGCGVGVFAITLCAVLFFGYHFVERNFASHVVDRPGFGEAPTIANLVSNGD